MSSKGIRFVSAEDRAEARGVRIRQGSHRNARQPLAERGRVLLRGGRAEEAIGVGTHKACLAATVVADFGRLRDLVQVAQERRRLRGDSPVAALVDARRTRAGQPGQTIAPREGAKCWPPPEVCRVLQRRQGARV